MADSARALVLHADREPMRGIDDPGTHQLFRHPRIAVEDRDLGPLSPDEVRVEVMYAGICGTDLHVVREDPDTGYISTSAPLTVPAAGRVLGHEGVGRVVEAGIAVEHISPGMIATFESIIRCHHCEPCRRGDFNQCERALLLGMERDGLFSTVVDVPSVLAHDVSDLADGGLLSAACLEPAACGYVACSLSRVRAGDEVVVFGAGPIGVLAAMVARTAFGAGRVHVVEPEVFRRDVAKEWADGVYDVEEFFDAPPRADVLLETSGVLDNIDRALRTLRANGRVALLARAGRELSVAAVDHMITNNISIVGSRGHLCGAFGDLLKLVRTERLPLHRVVTSVVDGLPALRDALTDPSWIVSRNCKVLAAVTA